MSEVVKQGRNGAFTVTLLSLGHFVTDAYSSFLLPLLPLLTLRLHLSPAQAGLLIPTMMITSSLLQPVFGMISDRYLKRAMSVYGPLIAAVFVSLIGLAQSLPELLACIIIGGIGIGAFHPQSAAIVSSASPDRRATTMSIFSSAGTVGFALGPVLITTIVAEFGLSKSYYAMVFGVAVWVLLLRYCPPLDARRPADAEPLRTAMRVVWAPLLLLYLAVVVRSAVHVSIQTYLPFLLTGQGLNLRSIGWVLSAFIFFGGIGGLFGGALADRWGARRVSIVSLAVSAPLLSAAMLVTGPASYLLLAVGGTFLNIGVPINVVMAQRLVPGGTSTVSALMMGFGWGMGALMTPVTGALSVPLGFAGALMLVGLLPLASAALLLRFPRDAARTLTESQRIGEPVAAAD
ncbi:MAG: MFS transporter [Acidobacteria bacterium]|nr:MFS transporter [Acidobacteriota bacterium]